MVRFNETCQFSIKSYNSFEKRNSFQLFEWFRGGFEWVFLKIRGYTGFDRRRPSNVTIRNPEGTAKTEFQADTSKPRCDWLKLSQSWPDWPRALSSQNQFGNPPKLFR